MLTWKQFKNKVEKLGVKDDMLIELIDIGPDAKEIHVNIFENMVEIADDPRIVKDNNPDAVMNFGKSKRGKNINIANKVKGKSEVHYLGDICDE